MNTGSQYLFKFIRGRPPGYFGIFFHQLKIFGPPYIRCIIEQRNECQIGLTCSKMAQVNTSCQDVFRNSSHGPSRPSAEQENQGDTIIGLRFKINGPVPCRPPRSRNLTLEGNMFFAQPFVHFVLSRLQ